MIINKHDTNGTKPLLGKGELGYDDYIAGGDAGRVYVGTGTANISQAKKAEVVAVDGKVDTHVARVDNPHTVTKAQVGLSAVDNTADSSKVVASAGKWTTSRNITIGNSTKSVDGTGNVAWTLAEIGAIGPASPALTGVPTAPTAAVNTNTTQLATTAFVNAEIANDAVPRVTSTDNAVVRFNGTTGEVQNSDVIIDDNGNVGIGITPSVWHTNYKAMTLQNYGSLYNGSGNYGMLMNGIFDASGSFKYSVSDYASMYKQLSGAHQWFTAPSGTAGNAISWTNAMTLDAGGNLLLGLSGAGVIQATNAIYSWNNASNYTFINNQTVSGATQVFGAMVAGDLKAAIYANGNFGSATSVYGGVSDAKLKENVVDATPKLEKLMQVQVRNFNFIGQEDKQIGVIAQEIEQIFPSLIFETKDTKQVEVTKTRDITDEEGNVTQEEYTETETQETGEVTKNVKYSIIYMMMLKGMQEQQEIINDLKSRIEILEGAK